MLAFKYYEHLTWALKTRKVQILDFKLMRIKFNYVNISSELKIE